MSRFYLLEVLIARETELNAITDIDIEKAQKMPRYFGLQEVYTDHSQILTELEAVSITTPDFFHKEPTICAKVRQ